MRPYYRFCRFWCQWFCLLFFRVRVFGRQNIPDRGGVLLVCNHQSFFDPVLVTMALHREGNYMARDTLFRNPWFRVLIKSLNAELKERKPSSLTLDLENLSYLDDFGALVIIDLKKSVIKGRGAFALSNVSQKVQETLDDEQLEKFEEYNNDQKEDIKKALLTA